MTTSHVISHLEVLHDVEELIVDLGLVSKLDFYLNIGWITGKRGSKESNKMFIQDEATRNLSQR